MKIDCVSDTHGHYPQLEGGDLLIVAGDLTANDEEDQYYKFNSWLCDQDYKKKIVIAGNHDNLLQIDSFQYLEGDPCFEYLCDSGTEFTYYPELVPGEEKEYERRTFRIWGSPWTKRFEGMNPHCMAFTCDTDEELAMKWEKIPHDLDILITHSPMLHVLDQNIDGYACGSYSLRQAIDRVKPRFFVFGHIHEQGGRMIIYKHQGPNTICVNASIVNEWYEPVNKPVRVIL